MSGFNTIVDNALGTPTHHRDNEQAYVSVNGKTCWATTLSAYAGTQQCGEIADEKQQWFKEDIYRVTACEVALPGSGNRPLTVRVWTNLNGDGIYESFGIDNVIVQRIHASTLSLCIIIL